jgi:hypothetical protein
MDVRETRLSHSTPWRHVGATRSPHLRHEGQAFGYRLLAYHVRKGQYHRCIAACGHAMDMMTADHAEA